MTHANVWTEIKPHDPDDEKISVCFDLDGMTIERKPWPGEKSRSITLKFEEMEALMAKANKFRESMRIMEMPGTSDNIIQER